MAANRDRLIRPLRGAAANLRIENEQIQEIMVTPNDQL